MNGKNLELKYVYSLKIKMVREKKLDAVIDIFSLLIRGRNRRSNDSW